MVLLPFPLLGDFQIPQLLAVLLDAFFFFSVIFKIFSLLASYISVSSQELVAVVVVEKMQQGWNSVQPWSCAPSAPTQQSVPSSLSSSQGTLSFNSHCFSTITFEINH